MNEKKNFIKYILLCKVILLVVLFLALKDNLYIGVKSLSAQNNKVEAEAAPSSSTTAEAESTKTPVDKPDPAKRKSFLDDLLNLPDVDTAQMKKDELGKYITLIDRKKRQVEDRLEQLKMKEAQLIKLEKNLDIKLTKLDEERKFFADTIQKERDLKGERTTQLAEFYKKMAPKKAAVVFAEMDKDLVIELFKLMPQKQITTILAEMDPQKSTTISEYFGRSKSGREYDVLKELNSSLKDEFNNCKGME